MDMSLVIAKIGCEQKTRAHNRARYEISDFNDVELPDLPGVPGQISNGERRYLYGLLKNGYTGVGPVVEVGSWLGLSTMHLAAGVRDSGFPGRVWTHDRYTWGGADDTAKSGLNLQPGDDFQPYFEQNIACVRDLITVTRASFEEITWHGEPIDVLFLDGPKTAQQLSIVLPKLAPYLIPGHSMLIFQDYQHPASYETPLAVQRLSHILEMRHAVSSGGTVGFFVKGEFAPEDTALKNLRRTDLTPRQAVGVWESIMDQFDDTVRQRLMSAMALHLHDLGDVKEAVTALRSVRFDGRLHDGWTNWAKSPKMYTRYKSLFDVYSAELSAQ